MEAGQQYNIKIMGLIYLIKSDLFAFGLELPKALFITEFQAVLNFRIYSYVYRKISKLLGFLLYERSKRIYSVDIPPTTLISEGFVIVHIGAIVIGRHVIIGKQVKIQSGVTLGMKDQYSGMPVIGDNTYLGTGCKVLGDVVIGNEVVIGANAVVINDVPNMHYSVGIPAKNFKRK